MLSIIVAVLFAIRIYSHSMHCLRKYQSLLLMLLNNNHYYC